MRIFALTLFAALVTAWPALAQEQGRSASVEVIVADTTFVVDAPEYMARMRDRAAGIVEADWAPIAAAAGAPGGAVVEVAVEEDIADWFDRRGVPPRNPEWAAGLALLDQNVILVRTANPEWESTLRHELAHIAVALASGGARVPVWFHEGFAIATAEQWSLERAGTMIRAGLSGNIHPFEELRDRFLPRLRRPTSPTRSLSTLSATSARKPARTSSETSSRTCERARPGTLRFWTTSGSLRPSWPAPGSAT